MSELRNTALWNIMETKAGEEGLPPGFATAVEKVCQVGITKAKTIICFFPNFTLHDSTHIMNVCEWMTRLLGNRANDLTACDAAMLLMAACCHDIGMSVSEGQEKELKSNTHTQAWVDYFNDNLDDWETFQKKKEISDKMLRNFVRLHHHERIGEQITEAHWDQVLNDCGLQRQDLIALCKSHGETLVELYVEDELLCFDMRLCAALLRLADILDFDPTRAPETLFVHIALDKPTDKEKEKSQTEYKKNQAGKLISKPDGTLLYSSVMDDPQLKQEVEGYLDWAEQELQSTRRWLCRYDPVWNTLPLPQTIFRKIQLSYCSAGAFQLTMDQERIIELLTGKNLYDDSCVFVRELLQNAVDAVLLRREVDADNFKPEDGKITITTWHDETGWGWFRIEDNGIGMDEHIIRNYFLKVGRSYYDSDDFKREKKNHPRSTGYQPISRFGIGILSCFISDENNQLQVSTRRYTDKSSGIRLHVTGRKGLYRLAVEGEQEKAAWQEMPDPDKGTHETYRTEPGTTICVGMNLFRLGDYRNIKEVVDKYVCFPEMQVTYRGPEVDTTYDYPTKGDFLEAVEQLKAAHGDTFPIVCRHPIPDEQFEELKNRFPNSEWDGKPELVLSYFPLDLFCTGNLCGMKIVPRINWHKKRIPFYFNYVFYELVLNTYHVCFADYGKSVCFWIDCHFPAEVPYKMETLPPSVLKKEENQKAIAAYERLQETFALSFPLLKMLTPSEKRMVQYVAPKEYSGTIAYNGVVAGKTNEDGFEKMKLLLSGSFTPNVNVARDTVSSLPVDAELEWKCLQRKIEGETDTITFFNESSKNLFLTERELRVLLDNHPEWEKELLDTAFDDAQVPALREKKYGEELTIEFVNLSLFDTMLLALLKKDHQLCYAGDNKIRLSEKTADSETTLDFPVQLFFPFPAGDTRFRVNRVYSISHPFSRWLIQNRAALAKELPEVYRKLLQTLIDPNDSSAVMNELNARLAQLKQYRNNLFGINDKLFLKESDF